MPLELNIEHTTLGRQIYDAGRRDAWISVLVELCRTEKPNLETHLEKLTVAQVKHVFDQVLRGASLWDACNDASEMPNNGELATRLRQAQSDGLVHCCATIGAEKAPEDRAEAVGDHLAILNNILRIREANLTPSLVLGD